MGFMNKEGGQANGAENSKPFIDKMPQTSGSPKILISKLKYHGRLRQLFGIHIVNVLLSMCTLGIYSFWGKTRIRKYMTSHLTLQKDRLEYTGTGKELFIGSLKALLIYLPLITAMQIPFLNLLLFPLFFGMISLAVYLMLRYRLGRTRWHGIRFSLGGSIKKYLFLAIKRTFFNIISFGFKIPKSDIIKWSYIANHMQYGEEKFTYQGDHKKIFKTHIITVAICFILMVVVSPTMIIMNIENIENDPVISQVTVKNHSSKESHITTYQEGSEGNRKITEQKSDPKELLNAFIKFALPLYSLLLLSVAVRLWYHAALWREKFRGLKLGNIRFKMELTGFDLVKLYGGNILIMIFTLSLGKPWAIQRTLTTFTNKLKIGGDLNTLYVKQTEAIKQGSVGDAFAADLGFDLGF